MKINCKKHGIVEGRFVGTDVMCEVCVDEPMLLAMVNMPPDQVDLLMGPPPHSMSMTVYRNVPGHEPDINGIED